MARDLLQSAESLVTAASLADRLGRKPVFIGEMVLLALALVGALITWIYRIETTGMHMESI